MKEISSLSHLLRMAGAGFGPVVLLIAAVFAGLSEVPLHCNGVGELVVLIPVLMGLIPLAAWLSDDNEEDDESAKTIVAMPAWMMEELEKEREKVKQTRAEGSDSTAANEAMAEEETASLPPEGEQDEVPEAPPTPEPEAETPAPQDDDIDSGAQTMAFSPADALAIKEAYDQHQAEAKSDNQGTPESDTPPQAAPEPPAEQDDEDVDSAAKTMAFSPADTEALRDQFEQNEGEKEPPAAQEEDSGAAQAESGQGDEMGTAQTMMFDVSQAQSLKDQYDQQTSGDAAQEAPPDTPAATEDEEELDQTMAYSKDDMQKLKDMLATTAPHKPPVPSHQDDDDDDGSAATQMYMPAMSQEMQTVEKQEEEEDDGDSKTVAYMPKVESQQPADDGGGETMMYSAEDKAKMLSSLQSGASADDAVNSMSATQSYSAEESKALREAYDLLSQSKKGGKKAQKKAEALVDQMEDKSPEQLKAEAQALLAEAAEEDAPAPQPTPAAPPTTPSHDLEEEEVVPSGMGTGTLILILLLLLGLAGAATAFILHFIGIIELPLPFNLPQLDLSNK